MTYVLLGILGVAIVHFCDPAAMRRIPFVKPVVWAVGVGLVTYATVMACLLPDKISLPSWATWIGWALLCLSLSLVVYSLFLNLPFHKTYLATGVGDRLITTGLYALSRHPGVLWTALLMIALVLVSRSRLVLIASPLFLVLDLLVVLIQDRFFFKRMFPGYTRYQKETPMLIPNRRSLRAFFASVRPNRHAA